MFLPTLFLINAELAFNGPRSGVTTTHPESYRWPSSLNDQSFHAAIEELQRQLERQHLPMPQLVNEAAIKDIELILTSLISLGLFMTLAALTLYGSEEIADYIENRAVIFGATVGAYRLTVILWKIVA